MNAPTCFAHRARTSPSPACPTCQRIGIEQDIVTRTVDVLLAAGFLLQTDILEDPRPEQPTTDRANIIAEVAEVDDEFLGVFYQDGTRKGWVRFVYGNNGEDVISDYTTNLESVLKPVNDYADSLS